MCDAPFIAPDLSPQIAHLSVTQDKTEVTTLDVEQEAVGFLLGAKGATLRGLETKHRTFMFFDNERTEVCLLASVRTNWILRTDGVAGPCWQGHWAVYFCLCGGWEGGRGAVNVVN